MSDQTVKVLVVAEEVLVRRALAMELAACLAGAEVTPAGGDEEATEILRQHPHDVALVDIGAQQEDGIKLLREIRARWPQMSGSGNMISLRAARNLSGTGAEANGRGGSQPGVQAAGLTRREVDVLGLLAEGATNRQISRQLFLSEKTVKAHLASAFRKLLVENRTQAAVAAVAMGIARLVPAKNTRASAYQASPA